MDLEIVIGLEVHVQLLTKSKLFCGCANRFTHEPNTNICPVCLGLPGVLPVLNRAAFQLAMRAALALNCEIPALTKFDRKHYYYPDLPKNYQISQYDLPMSRKGWLDIGTDSGRKRIGITRAHLEEDAGKLMHDASGSAVDLNRAGTPLLEIVSEPDLRSPEEARAYLEALKLVLLYTGVSDCNMEEGSLRCDANISVRPAGQAELGTKNEIKNMNSFRGVQQSLHLVAGELARASQAGEPIRQVTWGYSLERDSIFQMRTKEEANDYRYFPEPDLPPVQVGRDWVEEMRAQLPELPQAKHRRFVDSYGLSEYDAGVLTQDPALAGYFESVAKASAAAKESANWVTNDVVREIKERGIGSASAFPVPAGSLAELIALVNDRTINMTTARALFIRLIEGEGRSPREIVAAESLAQVSDAGELQTALEQIVAANPRQAAQIESGKHATAMWFVGQVMRAMKGQADPRAVTALVAERFGIDPGALQKKK